jgi:hypothetical protein
VLAEADSRLGAPPSYTTVRRFMKATGLLKRRRLSMVRGFVHQGAKSEAVQRTAGAIVANAPGLGVQARGARRFRLYPEIRRDWGLSRSLLILEAPVAAPLSRF